MKSIGINLKTTKLLKEYYQEQALDTIINDKEGTFTVELDADHEGIKRGVHFPIGFEHMVNYYGYLKGGNNYSNYREWAIKRLLGDKQYQVLVDSKFRKEIVKVDLYKYVHDILNGFDEDN